MIARPDHLTIRPNPACRIGFAGLNPSCKLTTRPAQVICPSGGLLTGLSSLISDFQKNISVPTYPKSHLELFASHPCTPRALRVARAQLFLHLGHRHCEEPTGPAFGRPDDKLRDEAI